MIGVQYQFVIRRKCVLEVLKIGEIDVRLLILSNVIIRVVRSKLMGSQGKHGLWLSNVSDPPVNRQV